MRSATKCIMRAAMGAAMLVPVGGVAWAHGPGGSTEAGNDVNCAPSGHQQRHVAADNYLYAGLNGVETCNDGTTNPSRGRIIVSTGSGHQVPGPYVAADGTYDNRQGGGSVRVTPPTKVTPPPPVDQSDPAGWAAANWNKIVTGNAKILCIGPADSPHQNPNTPCTLQP